jgi:meiotically up-regulated gene 157 (Mug157) protein
VPSSVQRRISTFFGLLLIALVAVAPASGLEIQSIVRAAAQYQNPNLHLQTMFRAALLDTTKLAEFAPDGTAYVKTGDIPAEWLRDASAQVRPYLYYAKSDPAVRGLLRAIIARQAKYVQIDP